MRLAVMWADGVVTDGDDATDLLCNLCGGWNPNTVKELRAVLAKRARIAHNHDLTDQQFLEQLDSLGVLTLQHISE